VTAGRPVLPAVPKVGDRVSTIRRLTEPVSRRSLRAIGITGALDVAGRLGPVCLTEAKREDVTLAASQVPRSEARPFGVLSVDPEGRTVGLAEKARNPSGARIGADAEADRPGPRRRLHEVRGRPLRATLRPGG